MIDKTFKEEYRKTMLQHPMEYPELARIERAKNARRFAGENVNED